MALIRGIYGRVARNPHRLLQSGIQILGIIVLDHYKYTVLYRGIKIPNSHLTKNTKLGFKMDSQMRFIICNDAQITPEVTPEIKTQKFLIN